jgi:Zn-dependent M16 (insulinase) family peptidase
MTYGNIPVIELQERFQEQVLKRFEPLERMISVNKAQRYHAPMSVEEAYATDEPEDEDKTHIVLGWLLGESIDLDQRLRAHLLSSVLLDNSSSPLMQALEQTDLGSAPSPLCGLEDSNLEMVFACGLDGSRPERSDATRQLVLDVLEEVASKGVPQAQVEAVLHQLELGQREIRGDGMPFGLQLVLSGLSTAMQRGDTLAAIDLDPALQRLRNDVADRDFIPKLVRELLLDNPHRVQLTLRPDNQISERRNIAEKMRLQEIKQSLTPQAAEAIVTRAAELAERQLQEDDAEILPKVTLTDIPAEMHIANGVVGEIAGAPAITYAQGTNGLVYQHVICEMPQLDDELTAVSALYSSFLTELGSGGRDYLQTQARQAEISGGIGAYSILRGTVDSEQDVSGFLVLRGKALLRNSDALAEMMQDSWARVRFDEYSRLRELVAQTRAAREQSVTGSGHSLAMIAAASGMSPTMRLQHELGGLAGIRALKALDDTLDDSQPIAALGEKLAAIHQAIQAAPRRYMLVAEEENIEAVSADLASHFSGNPAGNAFQRYQPPTVRNKSQQLWITSTEVNFCARAFATVPSAHPDAAALVVLGPFLRNGYLHRSIRETGGAYGGGATQDTDSASFRFYSYRDPRLTETLADFDQSITWLQETAHEPRALEEAILNVISGIDKPGSPAGEARSAWQNVLFGRTAERRQAFRQKILTVTLADLQRVGATYLNTDKGSTAVITSESTAALADVKELGLDVHEL